MDILIVLLIINYLFVLIFFFGYYKQLTDKEKIICMIPFFMIYMFLYIIWDFFKDIVNKIQDIDRG